MPTVSCIPKEPFIKLDENGKASVLNYNLPQATCLEVKNYIPLSIPFSEFRAPYNAEPGNHFWGVISRLDINAIKDNMAFDKSFIRNHYREGVDGRTVSARSQNANAATTRNELPYGDDYIARKISEGYMPVAYTRFDGGKDLVFIKKPSTPRPRLHIVLHLKCCSFLGDYGAGQTTKTFSLLPGEKNKISIRHYLRNEITQKRSEHILDSITESSVADLQKTVESTQVNTSATTLSNSVVDVDSWNWGGKLGLSFQVEGVPVGLDVNGGQSSVNTDTRSLNDTIGEQTNHLDKVIDSHVSKADSQRQIDVNVESSSTSINEYEETTVREIENINKSRVLNFVFRQL